MPVFESHAEGSPCWIDLMSPDVDASKRFYTGVFGWSAEDQFDDEGNRVYVNFSLDDRLVAGLGGQAPGMAGMPAIWNTYVCCHDLDSALAAAVDAGGVVLMPAMQVMQHGHMAIVTDPTGAAISLWKPAAHQGAELCNEPNTWSWSELLTRDLGAARAFYERVFGWQLSGQDMGPPTGTYWVVEGGDHGGWAGMMAMPPDAPDQVPNHWMTYFAVTDVAATLATIAEHGGMMGSEPITVPGVGTMAVAHDPHGGSFSLMQPETA